MKGSSKAGYQNSASVTATCDWNGHVTYSASAPVSVITINSGNASAKLYGTFYVKAFVPVVLPSF